MTNKQITDKLKELAVKYPNIEEFIVSYYGGGDSFDSMYSNTEGVNPSDYEDIVWELIERVGSDFNNDGSEGNVTFNLKDRSIKITDYYIVQSTELNQEIEIK